MVYISRYLYELDFGHELAQIYFFDFWQWDSMLIPPRGVRSQSRGGKLDFLAKGAKSCKLYVSRHTG